MFRRPAIPSREERIEQRQARLTMLTAGAGLHAGVYGGSTTGGPVAKEPAARPGKRKPTAEERAWMDAIVAYGCIACRMEGLGFVRPAVHHILRGGRRIGHLHTLPLCDPGHHQNGQEFGKVSRHPWKTQFEQRYGSEDHLLARLRTELGVNA